MRTATLSMELEDDILIATIDRPGEAVNTLSTSLVGEFESLFLRVDAGEQRIVNRTERIYYREIFSIPAIGGAGLQIDRLRRRRRHPLERRGNAL